MKLFAADALKETPMGSWKALLEGGSVEQCVQTSRLERIPDHE
jgi:hypothetical protein